MEKKKLITKKEAITYLKINKKVLEEMLNSGILNLVTSGRTKKIDKNEIDEWIENLNSHEEEQFALKRTICRFNDYFDPSYVTFDIEAENKYEAIARLSKFAKSLKIVRDHRWLYEVIIAREELISTAVGNGVVFLHPRHMHPSKIKKPAILFGKTIEPVEFDSPDNQPITLFFMLLLHNDKQHLFSLSYLSKLLMNKKNLNDLRNATTQEEISEILTRNY